MGGLDAKHLRAALAALTACLAAGGAWAQQSVFTATPSAPVRAQTVQIAPMPAPGPVQAVAPANVEWAATGVVVRAGGRLQINAGQGQWTTFSRVTAANVAGGGAYTNADGFAGRTSANNLAPNANLGALIGKIGENGAPFLVGSQYDAIATADGPLFLAINDAPGAFADNMGRMPVSVVALAPPPAPEQPPPTEQPTTEPTPGVETPPVAEPPTMEPPPFAGPPDEALPRPAAPPWLPLAIIAGVIVLLAMLMSAVFGRRAPSRDSGGAGAQVTARLVSDGHATQTLSISAQGGRRR